MSPKASTAARKPETETIVRVSVDLPADVLADYTSQAMDRNVTVEELLSQRLTASVNYTARTPIYLDDAQRQALQKVLGTTLSSPHDLVTRVSNLAQMTVEGTTVPVQAHILTRLRTRCFGMSLPDYLKMLTVRALESEAGLR